MPLILAAAFALPTEHHSFAPRTLAIHADVFKRATLIECHLQPNDPHFFTQGVAPEGYQFIDEEEEYIVAEDGRSGSWQPYVPGRVAEAELAGKKAAAKRRSKKKGETTEAAAAGEEDAAAATPSARRKDGSASQDGADMMSIEDI